MTKDELERHFTLLGISQTEAAELLGVAPRTVRRWLADEDIPGPVVQVLKAWLYLHQRHLPWGPHSVAVADDEQIQSALQRMQAMNVNNIVARVKFRGGARLPWTVHVKEGYAELGAMRVRFARLPGGGFSLSTYTRKDQPPNAVRDREFIEDAAYSIDLALKGES